MILNSLFCILGGSFSGVTNCFCSEFYILGPFELQKIFQIIQTLCYQIPVNWEENGLWSENLASKLILPHSIRGVGSYF